MISAAAEPFLSCGYADEIVFVVPEGEEAQTQEMIGRELGNGFRVSVVCGGGDRAASVRAGLNAIAAGDEESSDEDGLVLIHDAARPFVSIEVIERVLEAAYGHGAAVPVMPVKETVYVCGDGGFAEECPSRERLKAAQTPQGFGYKAIREAHAYALAEGLAVTDDGAPVLAMGRRVALVEGEPENKKITTQDDMALRVGIGFDAHRFCEGRPLMLGGIEIDFEKGLDGHSDADVLTHALMDAILGAMHEGDIGGMFPDTDPAYKGASSVALLGEVASLMNRRGYRLVNADLVLVAERPRMTPYKASIEHMFAKILNADHESISLKATTTERLGFTGREEGIAAEAVVLLESKEKAEGKQGK